MKKIIMLTACALLICACSSEDDNANSARDSRIVGTWETKDGRDVLTFNSNGTVVEEETNSPYGVLDILDIPFNEWLESETFYHWDGEWNTVDNSKLYLHWKKGRYMQGGKYATWKDIENAEESLTINYTISSDGKTFIEGDVEGEQNSKPIYFYKK